MDGMLSAMPVARQVQILAVLTSTTHERLLDERPDSSGLLRTATDLARDAVLLLSTSPNR